MLAVVPLLGGAAVTGPLIFQGSGFDGAQQLSLLATVIQLAVAGALLARIPGARAATIVVLIIHVFALVVAGLLLMVLVALPSGSSGPFWVGHPFNPVAFVAILVGGIALSILYFFSFRSALGLRTRAAHGA
jgi:hypothetical protein